MEVNVVQYTSLILLLINCISYAFRLHLGPVRIGPRQRMCIGADAGSARLSRSPLSQGFFCASPLRGDVSRASSSARNAEQGEAAGFEDPIVTINDKCLDCDVCRWMCPKTFGRSGIRAVIKRQPTTDAEQQAVLAAAIACPVGAIQTTLPIDSRLLTLFPREINSTHIPGVMHLGYHSSESMGATPYLVRRKAGNLMIDCPRYDKNLADAIERHGGVEAMVFTHWESVVEDHRRWKERFPKMVRIMHGTDYHPDASSFEYLLRGGSEWAPEPDIKFIHTPGHTVGSICVMVNTSHVHAVPGSSSNNISADDINSLATPETVLFSGDLITYSVAKGRLDGYKEYNKGQVWLQMRSMIALAGDRNSFQWLLPAHGRMVRFNDDAERSNMILEAAHALEQGGEVQNMMRVGYY